MPATQTELVSRSSADFPVFSPERSQEVQRRHDLLAEFLRLQSADALLLQRPGNIAWLTCGGDVLRAGSCHCTAAVFLTPDARVVLTNNVDSPLLFDGPLAGLGFQLKERPWHEARHELAHDLCRGRKVVSDGPLAGMPVVDAELSQFRTQLNAHDEALLRELARDVTHAVEATCRNCQSGAAESELAGQLLHRLALHQVAAVRVQVLGDGRGERYRHWGGTDAEVRQFASLSVLGRRHGLHVGVTRTLSFGTPPDELQRRHQQASLVLGTALYFTQAGWPVEDVWARCRRIYEKFGAGDEWRLAEQGAVLGYEPCEQAIVPDCGTRLQAGQPVFWHPSIGPAFVGDTVLIRPDSQVCLTRSVQWPMLTVAVKGTTIELPGILVRDGHSEWAVG